MKIITSILVILCWSLIGTSQTNGLTSYQLLNNTYNARTLGLTGNFITVKDNDLNLGINNPSLLFDQHKNIITFSNSLHAGGINTGMLGYGFKVGNIGVMQTSLQYVSYGKFRRTEINGNESGNFHPFEMVANVGLGREINERISIGASAKIIYSQLETYTSIGAVIDFGATYYHEEKGFLATILAKNIGYQFTSYTDKTRALTPINIQAGISYKIKHAPFRFSILAHNLQKWKIAYDDPNAVETIDPLTNVIILPNRPGFFDHLAEHFIYQAEVLIGKRIEIRLGFDYHKRKNLALEQRPGIAGLSCGFGLKFKKIRIDYGFMVYSRAGFNNMLTLSADLSTWRK